MKNPFPGMDPYLEHPALWPGVHQRLITYGCDALQAELGQRYFAQIGERLYVEIPDRSIYPDVVVVESRGTGVLPRSGADEPEVLVLDAVERREVYVEIRDAHGEHRVVTVIEFLSPTNKKPGEGRELYLAKQREVLESGSHLVEIDLLRDGEPTVALPRETARSSPYRAVICRTEDRRRREIYRFGVRDRLPRIAIPLLVPDPDVVLDLPAIFEQVYERGSYRRRIDYRSPALPPLSPDDASWAQARTDGEADPRRRGS
ncbi:MAG: DUF4058 family protein [Planctomycetes bacterium]|nr:DUF4058 family protein [Planctomycetota bacterium]